MSAQLDRLMMDYPLTLTHFFERSRRLFSKKTLATRIPGRPLFRHTYADFAERTTRLAGALRALGLRKGDRVATLAWNSHRHLEIYWAAPLVGCVLHTLNFRLSAQDLTYIVNHAEDAVIFADASVWPVLEAIRDMIPSVRLVLVEARRHRRVGRVAHDHDPAHARDLVADRLEHRPRARVGEDHRVLGMVDDVGEVLGREPEVQRVEDAADERRRPVDLEVAVAVPGQGRHTVALPEAEGREGAGEACRPLGKVRVRVAEERAAGDARGERLLREEPTAPLEEVRQRERVVHHEPVELSTHVTGLPDPPTSHHAAPATPSRPFPESSGEAPGV